MRKILSIVLVMTMLFSLAPMSFGADSEEKVAADRLNQLGLFAGTGTNPDGTPIYSLEGIPTRSQAITMLVKLLGKEAEAVNGTWDIPFTDVPNWAKPFVGYAYANGLTAGTSATTFGGNDTVTAAQYLTFVLKALGYEVGKDFQWNKAWELSDKLGITDGRYNKNNPVFLRGDIAMISNNALDKSLKGKDMMLLTMIQENLSKAAYEQQQKEEAEKNQPLKPVERAGVSTFAIKETGEKGLVAFTAKKGTTHTMTIWLDGSQMKEIVTAKSDNSNVCDVKIGSKGELLVTTKGDGRARLTIKFVSGVWEDTGEPMHSQTDFSWYGYSGEAYDMPGVALRYRGNYIFKGARIGSGNEEYLVLDVVLNGKKVTNYTVKGLEELNYKIQSDGTLLIYKGKEAKTYPFDVTSNGESCNFFYVVQNY